MIVEEGVINLQTYPLTLVFPTSWADWAYSLISHGTPFAHTLIHPETLKRRLELLLEGEGLDSELGDVCLLLDDLEERKIFIDLES